MKLKYVISMGIASVLSLGSLGWMARTEAQQLNTDFQIETISGDANILREFELSAVTRANRNEFSKVTFDGEEFSIEETIFDERHWLDGDQLANRELYRHMHWPSKFETDDFIITTEFDFSFTHSDIDPSARIAVKNRGTGEIQTGQLIFNEVSHSEWVTGTHVVESEDNFYYIVTTEAMNSGSSRAIIYSFNPETLGHQFEFEHQFDNDDWGHLAVTNQFIYFIPSPSEFSEEIELQRVHIETREAETKMISLDSWAWNVYGGNDFFVIETDTGFYLFDEQQEELVKLGDTSLRETAESARDGLTINSSVIGNYFIVNYETFNSSGLNREQYVAIFDAGTQELIFEGRIPLRNDQGLLTSFSVQLAERDE